MNLDFHTTHKVFQGNAGQMSSIESESASLVVTSPPYPMIAMWDEIMALQNPDIGIALENEDGYSAYELMHKELDLVWKEIDRVLTPGGIACINIGDATRTIGGKFQLYPNHSRIISAFIELGMSNLPNIIWRKQTNAPNKFMGSGMLPGGAYVTLEHEWILVFRKGAKRVFKSAEAKLKRQQSAYFWEERNQWFSDLWDLKGTQQLIPKSESRSRSAAYPFSVPYRLIQMYSLYGELVVDPFGGTGTTAMAAMASGRASISYDIDEAFVRLMMENIKDIDLAYFDKILNNRIENHRAFIKDRSSNPKKSEVKYLNEQLDQKVMTKQEMNMVLMKAASMESINDGYKVLHKLYHPQ